MLLHTFKNRKVDLGVSGPYSMFSKHNRCVHQINYSLASADFA